MARSALATPISLRGQVIGALDLFDPDHPREWTDDDLALVDAVTSQVALAVDIERRTVFFCQGVHGHVFCMQQAISI